ncbi:MAG: ABC transporter permease, partial [Syntrophorhabdales bacterium]
MSPRVVFANLVVTIKSFYRAKSTIFFTIAFPIILVLVFGFLFMNQENMSFDVCVQDLDQTDSSAQLIKALQVDGKFRVITIDPAINARRYTKENKLNLLLM